MGTSREDLKVASDVGGKSAEWWLPEAKWEKYFKKEDMISRANYFAPHDTTNLLITELRRVLGNIREHSKHSSSSSGLLSLFFFFWCGPFSLFLSLYWIYYNIASVFYVLFFWPWGMWDLSSPTRDRTHTPCIGRQSFNHWTTREVPGTLSLVIRSILTKTGA